MESDLLQEMKIMNGALDKELKRLEVGRFEYSTKQCDIEGITKEKMILVSVGSDFPADIIVHP